MPETAFQILHEHFTRDPERVCLTLLQPGQPDRPVTYRELIQAASGYAQLYEARGVQPGDVVILILQYGLDLIGAFWGAVLHGAAPSIMPFLTEKLLPDRYRKDLTALIGVTRPGAVVTYPEFACDVQAAVQEGVNAGRGEIGASGEDTDPRRERAVGGPEPVVLLCSEAQPVADPDFSRLAGRERGADEIVFLQHSSGTTGLQKGVAISHRALLNQLASYGQAIHLTRDDVIVSWLPLYHDMGLIAGFLMPILSGVPLVLMSPFDWVKAPYRLMQAISAYRGTLTWLPNFAFNFCAQKIRDTQLAGVDLSSWRAVINCSEPMFYNSFRAFAERFRPYGFDERALATSYAMAENVFGVTQGGIDAPVTVDVVDLIALQAERIARPAIDDASSGAGHRTMGAGSAAGADLPGDRKPDYGRAVVTGRPIVHMLSCGPTIPGTRVRVVDGEGRDLPERWVGELLVQSDCMLAGYYHRPDATAQALVDGWYRTGDLGYLAGGEVYVTGRKKDLIIVGGRNVFPQDLEALASEVPGVHPGRVAAFGILNEALGTEEVALVAEADLSEAQLADPDTRQALEDAIRVAVNRGSAVSLRAVRLVGPHWLVKTSSGKTARAANREKFLSEITR